MPPADRSGSPFSDLEKCYLKLLKEECNLSWEQIKEEFTQYEEFPKRSQGALQVHYSRNKSTISKLQLYRDLKRRVSNALSLHEPIHGEDITARILNRLLILANQNKMLNPPLRKQTEEHSNSTEPQSSEDSYSRYSHNETNLPSSPPLPPTDDTVRVNINSDDITSSSSSPTLRKQSTKMPEKFSKRIAAARLVEKTADKNTMVNSPSSSAMKVTKPKQKKSKTKAKYAKLGKRIEDSVKARNTSSYGISPPSHTEPQVGVASQCTGEMGLPRKEKVDHDIHVEAFPIHNSNWVNFKRDGELWEFMLKQPNLPRYFILKDPARCVQYNTVSGSWRLKRLDLGEKNPQWDVLEPKPAPRPKPGHMPLMLMDIPPYDDGDLEGNLRQQNLARYNSMERTSLSSDGDQSGAKYSS